MFGSSLKISASFKSWTERSILFRCPTKLQLTLTKLCKNCSSEKYQKHTNTKKRGVLQKTWLVNPAGTYSNYKHLVAATITTERYQRLMLHLRVAYLESPVFMQGSSTHFSTAAPNSVTLTSTFSTPPFTKPSLAFRQEHTSDEVWGNKPLHYEVTVLLPAIIACKW